MARFVVTQWNAEKLLKRPARILRDYGPVIAEETKKQISTVQFNWDRGTVRRKSLFMQGEKRGRGVYIPPGKRDAVDTGALLKSQTAPKVSSKAGVTALTIEWTAPYAGVVLRGGDYGSYVNVFGVVVDVGQRPGRDWITPALKAQPLLPFFRERWLKLGQGDAGRR